MQRTPIRPSEPFTQSASLWLLSHKALIDGYPQKWAPFCRTFHFCREIQTAIRSFLNCTTIKAIGPLGTLEAVEMVLECYLYVHLRSSRQALVFLVWLWWITLSSKTRFCHKWTVVIGGVAEAKKMHLTVNWEAAVQHRNTFMNQRMLPLRKFWLKILCISGLLLKVCRRGVFLR